MNLKSILFDVITYQEQHIRKMRVNENMFGKPSFNYEYKTVGLCVARRTGKTATITDMYRPGDLIIVHNESAKQCYPHDWNVISISSFQNECAWRGREFKYGYVFFDEIGLMRTESIYKVYTFIDADWFVKLTT